MSRLPTWFWIAGAVMAVGALLTAVVLSDADRACLAVQHETGKTCP